MVSLGVQKCAEIVKRCWTVKPALGNLAQLVERTTVNRVVVGSSPSVSVALNGAKRLGALSVT